jgi:hypothetical protein
MKRSPVLAVLAAIGLLAAGLHPAAAATPIRKESLDELVKKLEANAELWLAEKDVEATTERALKDMYFDKESVQPLSAVLRSTKKDDKGLYVIWRLLRYLQFAKTEVIRDAVPAVKSVHSGVKRMYRPLPRLSKRQQEALSMPDFRPSLRTPEIMRRMGSVHKLRKDKVAREKPVAKHNELVFNVERACYRLLLLSKNTKEDQAIVKTLLLAERQGSAFFVLLLEEVARDARKMDADRARAIYNALKPHGLRLKMAKRKGYISYGEAEISASRPSTYRKVDVYPGIKILGTMNRLATAAKLPALKVPTNKQVDEFHRKRGKR